ncbi:hypothetical protein K469DRAFT_707529 [Zopfia rhizophila CBS 207.26]|uniref:Uncharacterized protein n=1 Tax=Zopfia rhizophila CBS 207.26 TaxID=1314779 RepID=A0A6A6E1P7_9PEZI|nr:hypothetical protein K469DRAFT_707529 [Zopfia rhizophila CBS 207.26]
MDPSPSVDILSTLPPPYPPSLAYRLVRSLTRVFSRPPSTRRLCSHSIILYSSPFLLLFDAGSYYI